MATDIHSQACTDLQSLVMFLDGPASDSECNYARLHNVAHEVRCTQRIYSRATVCMMSRNAGFDSCSHEELTLEVVSVIPEKANFTDTSYVCSACVLGLKPSV